MEEMFYGINLILWLSVVILLFVFIVQIYYYIHYFSGIIAKNIRIKHGEIKIPTQQPPVSVIICARNEDENLKNFLPIVLEQNYPNFEVIVVNDASEDETELVLRSLTEKYQHLYATNIPTGTNIISNKKLAVTVGIKAAKNELLLFTDADCYPISSNWINAMVANIKDETEFVIGYGDYNKERSFISRIICYDTLFIAMQYMGMAYKGKPYMAVGRNLMYKKSTFYKHKGFAGHLHIASGDDDLMINKAGNKTNTEIASSAESKTMSLPEKTLAKWLLQKQRHLTASSLYTKQSRQTIGIEVLSRLLFYLLLFIIIAFANTYATIFALSLFIIRYAIQSTVINKTAQELNSPKHFIIIPFDILLPVISLFLMLKNKLTKRK